MIDALAHLSFSPLQALSGFGVGMLVGLTGVGGGSLMTPLLVLAFGIHPAVAVGTDLLYAAVTKASGTVIHGFNATIDWWVVRRLATGSVPAAAITLVLLHHFGSAASSRVITPALAVGLLLTAGTLLFRGKLAKLAAEWQARHSLSRARTTQLTILVGALIGTLVTLSSVGAGAIGVTALLFLYPNMPTVRIVGSDVAHAVPLTLAAGFGHWLLGGTNWPLLVSLLAGSIPGIIIGSHLAPRLPDKVLRPLLASVLVAVGAKMLG